MQSRSQYLCLFLIFLCFTPLVFGSTEKTPSKRLKELREKAKTNAYLNFDEGAALTYILPRTRPYNIILVLSADPSSCHACQKVESIVEQLSDYYYGSVDKENATLFFGKAIYGESKSLFQKLGVKSVPQLMIILRSQNQESAVPDHIEFPMTNRRAVSELTSEGVLQWIEQSIGVKIPFPEPLMSGNTATYVAAGLGLIMVGTSVKQFWQHRQNPILWWAASMMVVFFTYCGTVFNMIHMPPPFHMTEKGIMLFYPSQRHQFIIEGIIMGVLLCGASICFVLLADWIPNSHGPEYDGSRTSSTITTIVVLLFILNFLFKFFAMKTGGYPFRLYLI